MVAERRPESPSPQRRHYAMWMFTGACPSRCTYCDIASQQRKKGLSTEEVERVAQQLLDLGFTEVMFAGGEPLLSPDLPAALRVLRGKVRTAVFTGGLPGLADRTVDVLRDGEVGRLVFSIDSGRQERNDLIRGRTGITGALLEMAYAVRERLPHLDRSVNTVVSSSNVATVADVWERMAPFRLDSWSLTLAGDFFEGSPTHALIDVPALRSFYFETVPALAERLARAGAELVVLPIPFPLLEANVPPRRFGEAAARFRDEIEKELELYSRGEYNATFVRRCGCPLVGMDIVIGVDGEIYPCSQAPIIHPRYALGNVKTTPLAEILGGEGVGAFAAGVPHAACTRCWAPSNIPRDTLVSLTSRAARRAATS